MPGDRIVVDGLWRCLCPSIDLVSLSKPLDLWRIPRARSASAPSLANRGPPKNPRQNPRQQCHRHYSQASAHPEHKAKPDDGSISWRAAYLRRLAKRNPWVPGAVFNESGSFNKRLDKIPTRSIYAGLKELQDAEDTYIAITRLVEYLVKERGERPNAALYEILIKANVNKQHGSAKVAARLLKEAQSHNVPATPEMYQALLEVTAVHPDYVLRAQVLHDMKNRWYSLSPSAEISIVIGLLRDGQYELALSKLEELNKNPINVPPWLLDVFLYRFGELGFHEETLAILKHRRRVVTVVKRAPLSSNAWQFLLDVFSRDAFYPGVKFIWDRSVTPGHIHPPDGVVLNVLNAASAHGDITLAMSAMQELSGRGMKLTLHHYEALIHVHVRRGDLQKALTVLCIMAKAGLSPDLSSTRPIFQMLRYSSSLTDRALRILHELKVQYTIPAAAFNVVLESAAANGGFRGFRVAFDLYRTIRQVCINGPDLETFEILLRHCTLRKSMNFLVAEMEAFSLKPTQPIFDHLIRICSIQDDYEMAFHYLEKMRAQAPLNLSKGWWISKESALALLRRCIQSRDPRFEALFGECRHRGVLDEDDIKSLMSARRKYADMLKSPSSSLGSLEEETLDTGKQIVLSSMSA